MEELSLTSALLVAVSGFVVVFGILAVIALMITVISRIVAVIAPKTKNAPETVSATPAAAVTAAPQGTFGGEVALVGVDEKTAACVMAIVSDETGIPLNQLVFQSIKAL